MKFKKGDKVMVPFSGHKFPIAATVVSGNDQDGYIVRLLDSFLTLFPLSVDCITPATEVPMSESHSPPYVPDAEEREAARLLKVKKLCIDFITQVQLARTVGFGDQSAPITLSHEAACAVEERLAMLEAYVRMDRRRLQEGRDALDRIESWER